VFYRTTFSRGTAMFRAIGWKLPVTFVILATAFPGMVLAGPLVFSAAGTNPAAIQATVDDYRNQLGPLNANVPGSFGNGRREINWDGVPDQFASPNNLPANFFNVNSPRGAIFETPGSGFRVSANAANPTATPVRFGEINAAYPSIFQTF